MKRIFILVLLLSLCALQASASANPFRSSDAFNLMTLKVQNPPTPPLVLKPAEPVEPPKPEPVVYTVVKGDNLTKIGTAYNVEWQRLWAKNTQLTHPDLIHVGDKITIPEPSEALEREIPAAVALPATTPGVSPRMSYDAANTYDYGYCTWYVKNRRGASIPNGLGDAHTWQSRAAGMGMAVGNTPKAGAVGTTTRGALGHVVYVESVNDDGTINISEMNAPTWGKVTYRTASAGEFLYIY